MKTNTLHIPGIGTITPPQLKAGAHDEGSGDLCAMELVAFLAGERHTDKPDCTCVVIASGVRQANDRMSDDVRQRVMVPRLWSLMGTRADRRTMQQRAYVAADWAVRVAAPGALRANGLAVEADFYGGLAPVVDETTVTAAIVAADRIMRVIDAMKFDATRLGAASVVDAAGWAAHLAGSGNYDGASVTTANVVTFATEAGATNLWDSWAVNVLDRQIALTPNPQRVVCRERVRELETVT